MNIVARQTTESIVPDEQTRQFHQEGCMVLPGVITSDMLQMLREECAYFMGYKDAQMDARDMDVDGINHKRNRYFISNLYHLSGRLHQFIYSDVMAQITQAALGDDVFLFNEQWVVKGPEKGMKFAWHQDSGYIKFGDKSTYHKPYLTCWCTLDDVCIENGTVYILPHDRAGTREKLFDHNKESGTNDLIGYTGDDPGDPVICPAGSVVAFSSYTFHRSGANTSPHMRRIYLPQYSSEPIVDSSTGKRWAQAVPFIKDGKNIYDHAADIASREIS